MREATHADIPALVAMGQRFHAESKVPCPFDGGAVARTIAALIESPDATVIMTDTGTIGGALNPAYCAPEWVQAIELFWWAESGGLALLRAFEAWAESSGASEVRMTSLAALPRASAILERRGYTAAEISHTKVI